MPSPILNFTPSSVCSPAGRVARLFPSLSVWKFSLSLWFDLGCKSIWLNFLSVAFFSAGLSSAAQARVTAKKQQRLIHATRPRMVVSPEFDKEVFALPTGSLHPP